MGTLLRDRARGLAESSTFQRVIIALILVNAVILGLETSPEVMAVAGTWLTGLDHAILAVFVAELLLRIYAHRLRFFTDPWGIFDFVVVAISLLPSGGPFTVVRALRVLRVLRLVSVVPSMRRVVQALLTSLPGLGAIVALLGLVFYVAAVMATKLFAETFPEWFGHLGASLFTLFQVMTLESWSMGIVRPVMETHPTAWVFFIAFILIATFTMLNLFIAVVVNAMHTQQESAQGMSDKEAVSMGHTERQILLQELQAVRSEIAELRGRLPSVPASEGPEAMLAVNPEPR